MVFISVLLAMILGTLAYVAYLTTIAEARTRRGSGKQPDTPEKKPV